jgi:CRP-like cAMP-binding protein
MPHLDKVSIRSGDTLLTPDAPCTHVYFLEDGVCSISTVTQDGQAAGVAMIGTEGMIGLSAFGEAPESNQRAILALADGTAQFMDVNAYLEEYRRGTQFCDVISRYELAFTKSLMQSVACNALHSVEQRYARCVLEIRDRLRRDELPVTHDMIAGVLGVRRPSITVAANRLHRGGLIDIGRKLLVVRNAAALRAAACECYGSIKQQLAQATV